MTHLCFRTPLDLYFFGHCLSVYDFAGNYEFVRVDSTCNFRSYDLSKMIQYSLGYEQFPMHNSRIFVEFVPLPQQWNDISHDALL